MRGHRRWRRDSNGRTTRGPWWPRRATIPGPRGAHRRAPSSTPPWTPGWERPPTAGSASAVGRWPPRRRPPLAPAVFVVGVFRARTPASTPPRAHAMTVTARWWSASAMAAFASHHIGARRPSLRPVGEKRQVPPVPRPPRRGVVLTNEGLALRQPRVIERPAQIAFRRAHPPWCTRRPCHPAAVGRQRHLHRPLHGRDPLDAGFTGSHPRISARHANSRSRLARRHPGPRLATRRRWPRSAVHVSRR